MCFRENKDLYDSCLTLNLHSKVLRTERIMSGLVGGVEMKLMIFMLPLLACRIVNTAAAAVALGRYLSHWKHLNKPIRCFSRHVMAWYVKICEYSYKVKVPS